jgi:hypothetical protein
MRVEIIDDCSGARLDPGPRENVGFLLSSSYKSASL